MVRRNGLSREANMTTDEWPEQTSLYVVKVLQNGAIGY